MPDISMCNNKQCTARKSCYRFMAKPNEYRQSYLIIQEPRTETCSHYWSMKKEHE